MSELISKKLAVVEKARWTFNVGEKTVEVRAQVDRIVKAVLYAKDFVSSAVSSDPHAALAWAGVCVLLPLLLKPTEQQKALVKGLDQISAVICRYTVVEDIYRQESAATATTSSWSTKLSSLGNALETNITKLYYQIFNYQAHVVCHLFRPAVIQYGRDVFQADKWATWLEDIKSTNLLCTEFFAVIDSSRLQQGFEKQACRAEELHSALNSSLQALQQNTDMLVKRMGTDDESKLLQALFNSDYQQHKARNPDRVPGTCQWFLQNVRYKRWIEDSSSGLLWVTADPGCGKSVLSKSLIEHEFRNEYAKPSTTCYFFFKDDSADQRSITKAVCALLHQVLCDCEKPGLLEKATRVFSSHGTNMMTSFLILWELFLSIAQDQEAGEILCILDALDECEQERREQLIDALNTFHASIKETSGRLKILVTSRPYSHIGQRFENSIVPLAGEDESEIIKQEIDLVIRDRVPRIASQLKMDRPTQVVLRKKLLTTSNRTYLWLDLILEDVIKRSLEVDTPKRMKQFLKTLPVTIYEAYEHMWIQSPEPERARKLLHMGQKSRNEVDLHPDETFRAHIKNICGLFVSVIDSKVYLLHQTAKQFLESQGNVNPSNDTDQRGQVLRPWKHSMEPSVSKLVLAKICLIYLVFDDFQHSASTLRDDERWPVESSEGKAKGEPDGDCDENHSLEEVHDHPDTWDQQSDNWGSVGSGSDCSRKISSVGENNLLEYASEHWPAHFRLARRDSDACTYWYDVCNTASRRFSTWFEIHWVRNTEDGWLVKVPENLEPIIVASFLGHDDILSRLIKEGASVNSRDSLGRMALFWAAIRGHLSAVEILLANCAVQLKDERQMTPLTVAAKEGHEVIVKLLVENGAELQSQNCEENPLTALVMAAEAGQTTIVKYLLKQGASFCFNHNAFHRDASYNTLANAADRGHSALVKMIIKALDGPNFRKDCGGTSVVIAAKHDCWNLVRILLEMGARVDPPVSDELGTTPLAYAASSKPRDLNLMQMLIDRGADPNHIDNTGRTPLTYAATKSDLEMAQMLVDRGADPNRADKDGWTPLGCATDWSNLEMAQMLIDRGADPNRVDDEGQTPLAYAASKETCEMAQRLIEGVADPDDLDRMHTELESNLKIAQMLIDRGADPNHADNNNQTPLTLAACCSNLKVARMLIERGADPDHLDRGGMSPLAHAIQQRNPRLPETAYNRLV